MDRIDAAAAASAAASAAEQRRLLGYDENAIEEVPDDNDDDELEEALDEFEAEVFCQKLQPTIREQMKAADRLSIRLLAIPDDDEMEQDRILRQSLALITSSQRSSLGLKVEPGSEIGVGAVQRRFWILICTACIGITLFGIAFWVTTAIVGPPSQPVGPYRLVEIQEGDDFFSYYSFYEGHDSVGSDGYNTYVAQPRAIEIGIVNVSYEENELDVYYTSRQRLYQRQKQQRDRGLYSNKRSTSGTTTIPKRPEPILYIGSAPTDLGPRESIRLEGIRRFNRGLFIIDIRNMPVGCGVWPAFWLTDEENWPVNGEIDIVEGVNYQVYAKTALHATKGCSMTDIPLGVMTGGWDTAQGIPDSKTGIPDMTLRYAQNCFVYDPHQWLNQGCVAVHNRNDTIGQPLNVNGGGVYVLEWDPINQRIRTWVFTPHGTIPDNLADAIATANGQDGIIPVMPDPSLWPLPYGYFAVGDNTDCPAIHFRHMRLVLNTAFCGSVAGNRFFIDCPNQVAQNFTTCNSHIQSQPEELLEAYWKIRGVYVYEREWERTWLN